MPGRILLQSLLQEPFSQPRLFDRIQCRTILKFVQQSRCIASNSTSQQKMSKVDFQNGPTVQGLPDHRFASSSDKEVCSYRYDADLSCDRFSQTDLKNDPRICVYNQTTSVSLRSSMQSQVPFPYGKTPTHLNMPGGVNRREDKYIQGRLSDIINQRRNLHSFRVLSTADPPPSGTTEPELVDEHGNPTYSCPASVSDLLARPCPQGVQGEDCASFKLWLSNCVSTGNNEHCEALANEYIAGRKTLAQVFAEYDMEIRRVRDQTDK